VELTVGGQRYAAQRVFCIGRNYAAHAAELGNPLPAEPVVFMKPASSLVPLGAPLPLPRDRGPVHHEAELVLLVGSEARELAPETAPGALAGVTLGLDLTLRAEQDRLKAAGQPWELAKAFDHAAPLGAFVPAAGLDLDGLRFECRVGGELRQRGDTAAMLFPVPRILAFLSARWRLLPGDLVFTGTPAGVGPLVAGDEVVVESALIGRFAWRCE
jgi:2-keto-4-pentenoate hydratase/2-oxohepta-3-ene-1,7-dioic acid hydratase in catechol pathway